MAAKIEIGEGQCRREQHRRAQADRAEQAADRRAQHEAQAECRADHSHRLRALRFFGGVGDVGLCSRDRRRTCSVHRARDQQPRKRIRESIDQIAQRRAQQPQHDDRAPADSIGKPPEQRREDELHHRVGGEQKSNRAGADTQARGVHRQKRNHDAEAEQVEEDGREQDQARRAAGRRGGRRRIGWLRSWHRDLFWGARDEGNRMTASQSSKRRSPRLLHLISLRRAMRAAIVL